MTEAMLTVADLRVSYGRVQAVRDVSFRAEAGALVTLVGANGAGKSSIVNAISGILRPRGGRITFQGKDITRTPAHRLVREGLVQVPEGRQILTSLTIGGTPAAQVSIPCTTGSRSSPSGAACPPGPSPAESSRCSPSAVHWWPSPR